MQQVDADAELELPVIDLSKLSSDASVGGVTRATDEFVRESVDPSKGPLFSAKLLKVSKFEHVLILGMAHVITDGTSNAILHRELWTLFRQCTQNVPFSLPELPLQFGDYAIWQQQIKTAWLRDHRPFWEEHFACAPRTLIPSNPVAGRCINPRCETLVVPFGRGLSEKVRDVARRERTIPALVMLTLHVALISRWCDQSDVVLRFVSNARYRPEVTNMVGLLATYLHLRVRVADGDRFVTLLQRVHLELRFAREHFDYDWLPEFVPDCTTEFFFNWMAPEAMPEQIEFQDEHSEIIRVDPIPVELSVSRKFAPLFSETAAGISVTVLHQPDVIGSNVAAEYVDNLRLLVEVVFECPTTCIATLPLDGWH